MGPIYTLTETWFLNNRVNLLLLDELTAAQLAVTPEPRGRSVADQFAHLHNVRLMWLEHSAPAAMRKLKELEKGAAAKLALVEALEASGKAVAALIAEGELTGKVKGFKRGPAAFLGYVLAHEAHHRGQIILNLKHARLPVDPMFCFSLWEWDKV